MRSSDWLDHLSNTLLSAAAGAALMYFLDAQQGRRRVATVRDKVAHYGREARDLTDAGLRDLGHRASGIVAEGRGALRRDHASDAVIVERVRAQLGRVVSHPHAVQVTAADGCVTLEGPVLRSEAPGLLRAVRSVRGVREVDSLLDVHAAAGDTPALQGGRTRTGPRSEWLQRRWSAGPRLLAAGAAALLACYGLGRRDAAGLAASAAGIGLAARAIANRPLRDAVSMRHDATPAMASDPMGLSVLGDASSAEQRPRDAAPGRRTPPSMH
jgi:hypothetical protein